MQTDQSNSSSAVAEPPTDTEPMPQAVTEAEPQPEPNPIHTSRTPASVGRDVHLFDPLRWDGHRAAKVVLGPWGGTPEQIRDGAFQRVNANVFLDGLNDRAALAEVRSSSSGNTYGSAPLFDPLTPEQRARVAAEHAYWAEWPARI